MGRSSLPEELATAAAQGMAVAWTAARFPERPAILSRRGQRTFAEFNERINQAARALRHVGVESGDGVALLCTNRPEFCEVWAAVLRIGARLTPINWHLTAGEVAYIVDDCEARVLVVEERFGAVANACVDLSQADGDGHLIGLMVVPEVASEPAVADAKNAAGTIVASSAPLTIADYESLLTAQSGDNLEDPSLGTSMLYTSGTTGRPKGVFKPPQPTPLALHGAIKDSAQLDPAGDLALVTGPLYHAAPLNLNWAMPINSGVGAVLMDRWDAEETLRLIARHRVTHSHFVATMFHRMLQLPQETRERWDTSSLRWALHGAAPTPVHVKQGMIDWWGTVLYEYYAATEGGSYFVDSHEWLEKPGTVGRPLPGTNSVLLDEEGNQVAEGQTGTVYFEAPEFGRFEYFKAPEKTASAYRGNFFTMGDMGRIDADGSLFLTGRSAETIISGGVNIYPQEIDDVLNRHSAVYEVCTVGVPSQEWGESVLSVVELSEASSACPQEEVRSELLRYCAEHLPRYKQPREIEFAVDLPRLPTGKIQRHKVRAPYWAGRDRQI